MATMIMSKIRETEIIHKYINRINNYKNCGKYFFRVSDEDENLYIIERKQNRNRLNEFRSQLYSLLAKPIFPIGFSYKCE